MKKPPAVAIIGKPNVGKSTLFNRITRSRRAITYETPGVTRDTMEDFVSWNGVEFSLLDTGGFSLQAGDPLQAEITERIKRAAETADVVILLVDVRTGLTAEDEDIITALRTSRTKILLCVNKVEKGSDRLEANDFYRLGFGELFMISAAHGHGVGELLDAVVDRLPAKPKPRERKALRITVCGKPNVGKSSLVNALVGERRHIVSEEPGTTRDSINILLRYHGRELVIVDTAGIKRKARTDRGLPVISSLKSIESIKDSDIVLLMLDATEEVSKQDARIAAQAHRAGKGIVVLMNKWDLIEKQTGSYRTFEEKAREVMPFLGYAPFMTVSALTGIRITRILPLCFLIQREREKRVPTGELNALLEEIVEANTPRFHRGGQGRVYYATQTGSEPPTFTLFVNKAVYFPRSYIRYINNSIRKMFTFTGTVVRISLKSKKG